MLNMLFLIKYEYNLIVMKYIYLFCFVLGYYNSLSAQTFAPIGAEWTMGYQLPNTMDEFGFRTINVTGDTIKNGISCRIIEGDLGPHSANLFGDNYIYEDGGKVYAYYDQINQFQKIFDFDAEVGESWEIIVHETATNAVFDTFEITIDSTFVEILDGDSTKSYLYSLDFIPSGGSQCPDFIEFEPLEYDLKANSKLGAGHYLFPVPTIICVADIYQMEWNGRLRCYLDNDINYSDLTSNIPNCTYQNISIEEMGNEYIELVWNSTLNIVSIINLNETNTIGEFIVYDMNGKVVLKQNNSTPLNISHLLPSLYIVEFKYAQGIQRLKISL